MNKLSPFRRPRIEQLTDRTLLAVLAGGDVPDSPAAIVAETEIVAQKTGVTINVAASELDDVIEVAISTSGPANISSFNFNVAFDSDVVQLVDTTFGREFPFSTETHADRDGVVNVRAIGGFTRGSDLVTLRFERIGPGSAAIELAPVETANLFGQIFSGSIFTAQVGGQSHDLSGFDQAYYFLGQDDVNRDGAVTARDSLNVINQLAKVSTEGESPTRPKGYDRNFDTNGDGKISATDALRVINRLGERRTGERESIGWHPIFSSAAMTYLDPTKAIPDFVGRPGLPIDIFDPAAGVDLTPPTPSQMAGAETITVTSDGLELVRLLDDVDSTDLYVIEGSGAQIGFGLDTQRLGEQSIAPESVLTLAFFRADGTLIDAYPSSTSTQRVIFGAIDTVAAEKIYVRVGTTDPQTLDYRLEFLQMATSTGNRYDQVNPLDALTRVSRYATAQSLNAVAGYQWLRAFGPDATLGNDIHADNVEDATLVRTYDRAANFISNIDSDADVDWFRIPTQSDRILVGVTGDGAGRVSFELLDVDGNPLLASTTIAQAGTIEAAAFSIPRSSQVFVRVTGDLAGQYSIGIHDVGGTDNLPSRTASLNLPDVVGDTIADAAQLAIPTWGQIDLRQTIERGDDVDVYRIPNSLPGTLIVDGLEGITAFLTNADGDVIDPIDPIFGGTRRAVIARYPSTGLANEANSFVYLHVSSPDGFVGPYNVLFSFSGDVSADATDVSTDALVIAHRPDSGLGDDLHGDTIENASSFNFFVDPIKTSYLDRAGDIDVFGVGGIGELSFSIRSSDIDSIRLRAIGHDGVELPYLATRSEPGHVGITFNPLDAAPRKNSDGAVSSPVWLEVSAIDAVGQYTIIGADTRIANMGQPIEQSIVGFDEVSDELIDASPIELSPIETYQSSFFDRPSDRDTYQFEATFSSLSVTLHRSSTLTRGNSGAFHIYDTNGNLVLPVTETEEAYEYSPPRSVTKTYELNVGDVYKVAAINGGRHSIGSYSLQFEDVGNVLDLVDASDAIDLVFGDEWEVVVPVTGVVNDVDDIAVYRFSTNGTSLYANFTVDPALPSQSVWENTFRMQLFDAQTGQRITDRPSRINQYRLLDSAQDNATRDYALAVWNRREPGEFTFNVTLRQLAVETDDTVGESFDQAPLITFQTHRRANASPLDGSASTRYAQFQVHLNSASDVDIFKFTAENASTRIASFATNYDSKQADLIFFDLFTGDGTRVSGTSDSSLEELKIISIKANDFETVPGEIYYVRFSQISPNPIVASVVIQ